MDWQGLFYRQVLPTEGAVDGGVANGATTTSTTGLSASGTAPSTSGGSKDSDTASGRPQAIQFQLEDDPDTRIFTTETSPPPSISWKPNDAIQIEKITWLGTSRSGYHDIATVEGTSNPLLDYDDEADTIRLGLGAFLRDARNQRYHANNMVIQITWQGKSTPERGTTTSGVFTVANGSSEEDEMLDEFRQQFVQVSEDEREALTDGSETELPGGTESADPNGNGLKPGVSSTSTTVLSPSATSTTVPTTISSNESDSSDSGGGGGGGLSTGAIAGIAVAGAVVFLALIGGMVFWMLRRRRRNKDRGHYNQPMNSTTFMGGDKDIHQVTESPHSTYSNDQHVPLSNLAGAGTSRNVGGPTGHHDLLDDDADYAPYRDDDRGAQGSAAGQRTDGAGTPHGVSRSVAHLVEDGMTEDEIRRLEEEERQLDDAIQRHGRGR